jgi:hypothetical protein
MKNNNSDYAFQHTIQMLVYDSNDESFTNPSFGSGLVLEIEDNIIFITVDHVTHYTDHELTATRTGPEDVVYIEIPNSRIISTGPFFNFTNYKISAEQEFDEFRDQDLIEISYQVIQGEDVEKFSCLKENHFRSFLNINDFTKEKSNIGQTLFISGITDRKVKNECILAGEETNHKITITSCEEIEGENSSDKYFKIYFNEHMREVDWKGLSGGPVFNENQKCIGVLQRAHVEESFIIIIPIGVVFKYINLSIKAGGIIGLREICY